MQAETTSYIKASMGRMFMQLEHYAKLFTYDTLKEEAVKVNLK